MKHFFVVLFVVIAVCALQAQSPEPAGWYAGDMHVHRSCGGSPTPISTIYQKMGSENLAAVSLLADMGNAEVQDPVEDLPRVNGQDDPVTTAGRIVHWDAEWHWDATYSQYAHQALGGHLIALGLTEAHQIWDESTHTILDWAHKQNGIAGFAHMQYLDSGIPQTLTCCTPVEYPVEVALGAADFISEDVMGGDTAIQAYYRLLNSGFRPGFAAGTDFPCNDGSTIGAPLTYVRVANGEMTYRNWIEGISSGRTVVSRNGHSEFLDLKINDTAGPGDEVRLATAGSVQVSVQWSAIEALSGTIEIVSNGVVVAGKQASASSGSPSTLSATVDFTKSGWIAARRTGTNGHVVHTAAVFVIVSGAPIRVNTTDPQFYVQWMDYLLSQTSSGGPWNKFYPTGLSAAQARYQTAKALFQQLALEAQGSAPSLTSISITPTNPAGTPGTVQQLKATGSYSNGASLDLSSQVLWASSSPTTASVSLRGLIAALNPGSTTISATLGSAVGTTIFAVQQAPLAIKTQSLPTGTVNTAYSTTLAAQGGTEPYTWSIAGGSSMPAGLSLSSSGQISGTPTIAGTTNISLVVTDSANTQASKTLSLTINAVAPPSVYSLWPSTTVPGTVDSGPDNAVELGVRFKSDIDANVVGVRFYKSAANTGTHTGTLWSSTGTKLASATFDSETASGWQQVNFSSPVTINAGSTYIASYHTNTGHYSDDLNFFASTGIDNAPLHALQDSGNAPNGVYAYGSGNTFPSFGWNSSNYWVDVAITPAGPDTTPPSVLAVSPIAGAPEVGTKAPVVVTFSEALDLTSVTSSSFVLVDSAGNQIPATVAYTSGALNATLTPNSALLNSTVYTAVLKGGTTDPRVKDLAGNALANDYRWSFTTAAPPPPPPNDGPGGPILIASSSSNPFSRYYTEILRAEGLNEFTAMDISLVDASTLASYDVVILGELPLTSSQVTMFTNWVTAGGNLIAMHPDKSLASLLGLTDTGTTLSNAYLLLNTSSGPGVGLVGQSMQFHGTAIRYTLNGATSYATLYSSASTPTSNPAITLNHVGLGSAAAFAFDLARSVVYTRQGNPAWSGQARDGQSGPIRPDNLFYGQATFDPQPDWVNRNKVAIPQADEQQRFLANLILQLNQNKKPLPRFWYFPKSYKAAVVMTGDDHGAVYGETGATAGRFDYFLAASPSGCSVQDWTCIRGTSYVVAPIVAPNALTSSQAQSYVSQGFEVSVHSDSIPTCSDWTPADLDSFYASQIASFSQLYPTIPAPKTHRMHCVSWSDFDSQPKAELAHGIRLDTTYYYWPPTWVNDVPGLFTGSGMPMRYADRDGNIIDVYQATSQMTDESGQSYPAHIDTLLDNALGATGYYGFFTANMHNDGAYSDGADAIVDSAKSRGVPVISAGQLLTWLDGRNGSSFGSAAWNGGVLTFTITVATGANGLQAMLPASASTGGLSSITLNGNAVAYTLKTIKGVQYAVFSALAGTYRATYSGSPSVSVSSVTLNPSSVAGGNASTGTVTLSGPAPSGGASVALAASDPTAVTLPQSSVVVSAGATSATFAVNTNPVSTAASVTISASYGGSVVSSTLSVAAAPGVAALALNPSAAVGSKTSIGTVTLTQPAPTAGATVILTSANAAVATVPANVVVSAGSTTATFTISTSAVAATTPVAITANYGTSQSATLTINPPTPSSLALSPASVGGGGTSTGTITLSGPAPTGGASIALTSSNTNAATVPASVVVSAGATTATFAITTKTVTASTTVTINASYGGGSTSASVTVTPVATLSALSLSPTSVVGGRTSTATVTLTQAAPSGGVVVTLSSANSGVASVPASLTIAAGSTTATFTASTSPVSAQATVVITATSGATSRTATITVTPPALSSIALSPTSVYGGTSSTGTVTLTGPAASGGIVVSLTSSNTTAATVPASVTVAAGSSTASFSITTKPVSASTTSSISGTYGGLIRSATLTVRAPTLTSLTLSPTSVRGGYSSTGSVTLNAPASTAGVVVSLASSSIYAVVPTSVTVLSGRTTATFTITTRGVLYTRTPTISATYNGTTRTATLTITR